jgi:palmitoyltransferase
MLLYLYDKLKDYFPSTNILDIPNNEGMTSLHLSCFYSFKNMSDTLLLLGCNINIKDPKGYTPLHYAVKVENYRLCKKLIVFGANKNLRDNENNTPGDLAMKTSNFSLKKLFNKNILTEIDSIINKRRDNLLFILLLMFSLFKYYFFFKSFNINKIMNYIYIVSFIVDIICIILTLYPRLCPNKLSINKKRSIIVYNFEDIFEQNNYDLDKIELLCPICKIIKLKQSKIMHCIICNKCIDNWDHHCFWLNICINKNNYNLFRFFMIFLFLTIIINTYIFIFIASNIKIFSPNFNYLNTFLLFIIILMIIILLYGNVTIIRQIYLLRKNKKIDKEKIVSL